MIWHMMTSESSTTKASRNTENRECRQNFGCATVVFLIPFVPINLQCGSVPGGVPKSSFCPFSSRQMFGAYSAQRSLFQLPRYAGAKREQGTENTQRGMRSSAYNAT